MGNKAIEAISTKEIWKELEFRQRAGNCILYDLPHYLEDLAEEEYGKVEDDANDLTNSEIISLVRDRDIDINDIYDEDDLVYNIFDIPMQSIFAEEYVKKQMRIIKEAIRTYSYIYA